MLCLIQCLVINEAVVNGVNAAMVLEEYPKGGAAISLGHVMSILMY